MKLSAAGLALIKESEGFRSHTYRDAAGFPTIGYGHRLKPLECFAGGIKEPLAAQILSEDIAEAQQAVERLVKVPLTQGQFDALVDFCLNLGAGRLASSTLLKLLNQGNHDAARAELLLWDFAGNRVLPGLKARRQAEFVLWGSVPTQNKSPLDVNESSRLRV